MKKRVLACTSVLMLAVAIVGFAAPADSDYPAMMKKAVAARGALNMSLMMADWPAVATNATAVQDDFKAIEEFWTKRGNAQDAIMFSANIEAAAKATHDAAAAGNADGATNAAKGIAANCGGCHMAHRGPKADDGSYPIK
jgi:hypothetical protein